LTTSEGEQKHAARISALSGVVGAFIGAAATVGAALLGNSSGTLTIVPGQQPTVTVAAPTVTVTQTVTGEAGGQGSTGQATVGLPAGVQLRRETGSNPVKLSTGYGIDLDDNTSPNWNPHTGPLGSSAGGGNDIGWGDEYNNTLRFKADYAIESRYSGYATCAEETSYHGGDLGLGDIHKGEVFCVRTDSGRYAAVTLESVTSKLLVFNATVWDPPFQP
jgi:hypothetical protein